MNKKKKKTGASIWVKRQELFVLVVTTLLLYIMTFLEYSITGNI